MKSAVFIKKNNLLRHFLGGDEKWGVVEVVILGEKHT